MPPFFSSRISFFSLFLVNLLFFKADFSQAQSQSDPFVLREFHLGTEIGKLRAAPIRYAPGKDGFLIAYSESEEVDPFVEMFFFPKHTMKLVVVDQSGEEVWRKDLGRGVMPGIWFCPVFPFDLDKDGVDEIWFVNNPDEEHPLAYSQYRLERWNATDGKSTGHWKWPSHNNDSRLSHLFRNFVFGGYVDGEPVLITAQGTYKDMKLQAWNPGMEQRWDLFIKASDPGARGSHMCPIVDIDADGKDELMWGERCISLDNGQTLFVGAEDSWQGHSDIIQPLYHEQEDAWYIFTCREDGGWDDHAPPRVVMFDQQGQEVWRKLDRGHMDMGWVARLKGYEEPVAFTVRIGNKKAGPDGFYRADVEEFAYLAFSGKEVELPFQAYNTVPVDFDGDGVHELVGGLGHQGTKDILRGTGEKLGNIGEKGTVAMASKLLDHPGEQIFVYYPDGTIRIWADRNARDAEKAIKRYQHPFYRQNRALTATGYNLVNLGGL